MEPPADKSPIRVGIRMRIPAKMHDEALMILNSVTEMIRIEEGCVSCRLYQDLQETGALMLEQVWARRIDMERHLNTEQFHTVLLVVEMASEFPEIQFDFIERTSGMETIQKIRG
jgi:quinol monooxygenase YgiN